MTVLSGMVLAQEANYYRVRLDPGADAPTDLLLCTRRARLMKTKQPVYVGDRVQVTEVDWQGGRAAISEVLPRQSLLVKPPIANCNKVLVVFALLEPAFDPVLLSRFLVCIETEHLKALVCLNKSDQATSVLRLAVELRVRGWGYGVCTVSTRTQDGIGELAQSLDQGTFVLAGPSGVGKSSLLNALHPGLKLRVGAVSDKLGRGKHTTRHVELFALESGALVADAPGFSQLDITCPPRDLAGYFPEFRSLPACQFRDCLHGAEPGCMVRQSGLERYEIYLTFLAETIAHARILQRTSDPEETLKAHRQVRGAGEKSTIPRLDANYRKPSRRSQRQQIERDGTGTEDD